MTARRGKKRLERLGKIPQQSVTDYTKSLARLSKYRRLTNSRRRLRRSNSAGSAYISRVDLQSSIEFDRRLYDSDVSALQYGSQRKSYRDLLRQKLFDQANNTL